MNSESASIAIEAPSPARLSWSARRLVALFQRLRYGRIELGVDGQRVRLDGSGDGPAARISIQRPGRLLRRLFWRGDLGFAEGYIDGDWTSDDPAALLYLLAVNLEAYEQGDRRGPAARVLSALQHRLNRNTRGGSRRNIAAHYDLGNDFYARWLDAGMTYSSALFDGAPDCTDLDAAQQRKYARMLALTGAKPGETILEIGCGWGAFAEYAARRGHRVIGLTLSREQLAYARDRIARAGLAGLVDLRLCDYRDFDGHVDHIVSIEMFEAVGREYWHTYFATLQRCLRPGGRAALQVITIDESLFDAYVANPGGFIQRYIFPGGMLPTKSGLGELARQAGLQAGARHAFGIDYAATLAHWHTRFNTQTTWLDAHGYDDRFRRMWRYYLAFCEAGFRAGQIDVVQCALQKPQAAG
ncbi:MAG: class I SAM-dependent methyltransferase [Gammaproteobacteria bacterium]|nr:class I SAM-dependent methyltransferase [Gammaproteobacteria bacterium]